MSHPIFRSIIFDAADNAIVQPLDQIMAELTAQQNAVLNSSGSLDIVKASYWASLGVPPPLPPLPPPPLLNSMELIPYTSTDPMQHPISSNSESTPAWHIIVPITVTITVALCSAAALAAFLLRSKRRFLFGWASMPGASPDTTLVVRICEPHYLPRISICFITHSMH